MDLNIKKILFVKKYWLILFAFSILFVLGGVLLNNFYFSKVIFTGPISIEIKGINKSVFKNIDVWGISPTGKKHEFVFHNEELNWKYNYPCFIKSISIKGEDSLIDKVSSIMVTSGGLNTNMHKNQMVYVDNYVNIFCNEVNKPSFFSLISCMLKWDEPLYIVLGVIAILFFFLILKFANKIILLQKIRIKWHNVFLLLIFIFAFIHAIVLMISNKILITSGILIIIFGLWLIYIVIFFFVKIFQFSINFSNLKLLFISVGSSLIIVELIIIFSGLLSTSFEKRDVFFIKSAYRIEKNSWYYVWSSPHYVETDEYSFYRSINSEGLSDIEHPIRKGDDEYRIMGIGDSFTEGDGAHQDSTWLKFLENILKEYPTKCNVSFMNAGVCGSDVLFEYVLFKERLMKYEPDLLILSVNMTDIGDVVVRGGMERFNSNGEIKYNTPPWWASIYNSVRITRIFFSYFLGYNEKLYRENDGKAEIAKKQIYDCILLFNELCKQNQIKFLVVFHPLKHEIKNNAMDLNDVQEKINAQGSVNSLNMLNYFTSIGLNEENCKQYFWVFDGHHNAKGYEIYARGVEWKLNQMGILDSLIIKPD